MDEAEAGLLPADEGRLPPHEGTLPACIPWNFKTCFIEALQNYKTQEGIRLDSKWQLLC